MQMQMHLPLLEATPNKRIKPACFTCSTRKPLRALLDVLLVCDEAGLIGKEMFAVDGVKLPSNASKEWSGTKADFKKKARKLERGIEHRGNARDVQRARRVRGRDAESDADGRRRLLEQ